MKTLYSWPPRVLQTLAWFPVRALLVLFCGFETRGKQNLQELRQAILAVNHANELDPIIVAAALLPLGRLFPVFYIVGPYHHFTHERFGWRRYIYTPTFFRAWGAYAADRGFRDYARSLHEHIALLKHGKTLCVFPEGGIARDGQHKKAHGGVAYLCAVSRVPVVPVSISGSHGLGLKAFLKRKNKLRVSFGEPIYPGDLFENPSVITDVEEYKRAAQRILEAILSQLP